MLKWFLSLIDIPMQYEQIEHEFIVDELYWESGLIKLSGEVEPLDDWDSVPTGYCPMKRRFDYAMEKERPIELHPHLVLLLEELNVAETWNNETSVNYKTGVNNVGRR